MTSNKTLAKAAALLGGLTLLAVAVQAQSGQTITKANNADDGWDTIRWQFSGGGGTTTGTTGGGGGIIIGPNPRPLSEVVVLNPSMFVTP